MIRSSAIPVSAVTVETLSGVVTKPDAWTFGKKVELVHKTAYQSQGYKSEYAAVQVDYIILRIEGEPKARVFSYSGKNLKHAIGQKDALRSWLAPAPEAQS